MATNFPGSLDSFTNPVAGDSLASPSHAGQHADVNDAIEALQVKVGVGAGTIGTWTSWTPTWTNLTVGNGTVTFRYTQVNKLVHVIGSLTFGSTTSVSGTVDISLPVNSATASYTVYGLGSFVDSGVATYMGVVTITSSTLMRVFANSVSGSRLIYTGLSSTSPFTWTTGDSIRLSVMYEAA